MTEYILHQIKKICDNPKSFEDALIYWNYQPEREQEAIKKILTPNLQRILMNPRLISDPRYKAMLTFQVKNDPLEYFITGVVFPDNQLRILLLQRELTN